MNDILIRSDGPLELGLSVGEVEAILAPFITRTYSSDDANWQQKLSVLRNKQRRSKWRRRILGSIHPGYRRTQQGILTNYSSQWADYDWDAYLGPNGASTPYAWRNGGFDASSACMRHVYLLFLMRAIGRLKPHNVLDVGFGSGHNLLMLSCRFSDIAFSGIELTEHGVETARRVAALPELPEIFSRYSPEPLDDIWRAGSVDLRQGNARNIPFERDSFELVYTVLALEQMEEIRSHALAELARVSARYVIMIEPFRDWNETGMRRDYIIANDYFAARVADFEKLGFKVIFRTGDFPHKVRLGVGFVVFEKKSS